MWSVLGRVAVMKMHVHTLDVNKRAERKRWQNQAI